jgi:hypothetical protein
MLASRLMAQGWKTPSLYQRRSGALKDENERKTATWAMELA